MRLKRARVLAARMAASGEYTTEQIAERVGMSVDLLDTWSRGRTFCQIVDFLQAEHRTDDSASSSPATASAGESSSAEHRSYV